MPPAGGWPELIFELPEVRYPDRRVLVRIEPERLGTTSLTTRETIITPSGEVAAEARIVTVRWDAALRKPAPFTAAERARLEAPAVEEPAVEAPAAGHPADQTGP